VSREARSQPMMGPKGAGLIKQCVCCVCLKQSTHKLGFWLCFKLWRDDSFGPCASIYSCHIDWDRSLWISST